MSSTEQFVAIQDVENKKRSHIDLIEECIDLNMSFKFISLLSISPAIEENLSLADCDKIQDSKQKLEAT